MSAGSWIIVDRQSQKPVCEVFSPKVADRIRNDYQHLEVLTALEWLVRFNKSVREQI